MAARTNVSGLSLARLRLPFGDFVRDVWGWEMWSSVLTALAELSPEEQLTPDELGSSCLEKPLIFLRLTQVMSSVSKIPEYDIGRAFGKFFFQRLAETGYHKLLTCIAHNFTDFLYNLNNLYLHLATVGVLHFAAPEFKVLKAGPESILFRYRSRRAGLASWIVGICEFMGKEFYHMPVVFNALEKKERSSALYEETWEVTFPTNTEFTDREAALAKLYAQKQKYGYVPEPLLFYKLFPYHILMDQNMNVRQLGVGLRRLMPDFALGTGVQEEFEILSPYSGWEFEHLGSFKSTCFAVKLVAHGLVMKGSFHPTTLPGGAPGLLFTGTPRLKNLNELQGHGIFMSDIPPHDMSTDFVVMAEQREVEAEMVKELKKDREFLQQTTQLLEKHKTDAENAVSALKQSLAEALSLRDKAGGGMLPTFDSDTPADKTLKMLNNMLNGDEVNMKDVMELRDAIVASGTDMHTPVNLVANIRTIGEDKEISKSIMGMLSISGKDKSSDGSHSSGDDEEAEANGTPSGSGRRLHEAGSDGDASPTGIMRSKSDAAGLLAAVRSGLAAGLPTPPASPSGGAGGGAGAAMPPMRRRVPRHKSSILFAAYIPDHVLNLLKGPSDPVLEMLAKIDEWKFDAFALDKVTEHRPLSALAFAMVRKCGLLPGKFGISEVRLARWLCVIEDGYPDNPYHSRIHAADVLRSLYIILTKGGVIRQLCSDETYEASMMAAIFAAVIHDYEHKGVNNDFLVKSADPLALLYNDTSPMENHHLAAAFKLMLQDDYNFLKYMAPKHKAEFRKTVIAMVLATDMKQHFAQQSLFTTKLAPFAGASNGSTPRPGSGGSRSNASMDDDTRSLVLQMCLKCADLGHLATSPKDVHMRWVQLLEEEFFRQGDQEKEHALPVSALMDRTKQGVSRSQPGFYSIVALPQFSAFCKVFPGAMPLFLSVMENYNMWVAKEKWHAAVGVVAAASPRPPASISGAVSPLGASKSRRGSSVHETGKSVSMCGSLGAKGR